MINNDEQFSASMERIAHFQRQVVALRLKATSDANYRAAAGGFLAEIDRMMLEVREYLWSAPAGADEKLAVA